MRILYLLAIVLITFGISAQETNENCKDIVHGTVINKEDGKPLPNVLISLKQNRSIIKEKITDELGKFSFELDCNGNYQISAVSPNFTKNTKLVFTSKKGKKHQLNLELFPLNEFVTKDGKNYLIINQIIFLPDDYSISNKDKKSLDLAYELLNKYKHLKIEIGFHTDSRGNSKFLQKLSQKRANVCANYLIKKGIDSERVVPKGYGDSVLLNNCSKGVKCTNAEHLVNRRTEFLVLNNSLNIQQQDIK